VLKKLCFLIFIFSVMFFTLNSFDCLPGDSDGDQDELYGSNTEGRYRYTYISYASLITLKDYKICTTRNIIDEPQFDFI